ILSEKTKEFANLFRIDTDVTTLNFETLYLGKKDTDKEIAIASQYEMRTGKRLVDSDYVSKELREARSSWIKVLSEAKKMSAKNKTSFIARKRKTHFAKYPKLAKMQEIINSGANDIDSLMELLDALPYAKFNLENFAKELDMDIQD